MKPSSALLMLAVGAPFSQSLSQANAQTPVRYSLQRGSELTEVYCLDPCACPLHEIRFATSGTFVLTLLDRGPLFDTYSVTLVDWVGSSSQTDSVIRGSGTYRIGGEVAVTQQMTLNLSVNNEPAMTYDSGLVFADPQRQFPLISIMLQTEQFGCRRNDLTLFAEPSPCRADWNNSGTLDSQDFFDFLAAFFTNQPTADFNQDSIVNSQDFFDFIAAFFAGC